MQVLLAYQEEAALSAIPKPCGLEAATQGAERLENADAPIS